jgi:hypothetical protein
MFYFIDLQPYPVFEGELERVSALPPLSAEEQESLLALPYTYYPRLQENDETDRPIYLIHPPAPAPVFVAREMSDGAVIVYPQELVP